MKKYVIKYEKASTGSTEKTLYGRNPYDAVRKLLQDIENNAYDVERIIDVVEWVE